MFGLMEATFKNYQDVINKSELMNAIEVRGEYSQEKDVVLYRAISNSCKDQLTKLTLKFVNIQLDIGEIAIFANVKELELTTGTLSWSFLKLNVWCPNLEYLQLDIGFDDDSDDDWMSIAETHASPLVRKLTIAMNIDSKEDVYYCFEAMEKQFPSLENLYLDFGGDMAFTLNRFVPCFSANSLTSSYEPIYFKNLKILSVFAFGDCDDIFNYLKISNAKLKDITFSGMNADKTLIKSLCNFPKLNKLKLDCPYVYENELGVLCSGLPKLMTLVLDTKVFHWNPTEMMEFIKNSPRLRRLQIYVDRKRKNFKIEDKLKEDFQALVHCTRRSKIPTIGHQILAIISRVSFVSKEDHRCTSFTG